MRIAYGVFGYGRGHATRALGVLDVLAPRHDILLLAGGDAYDTLSVQYPVHRIPRIGYEYGSRPGRSIVKTLVRNFANTTDALFGGVEFHSVVEELRRFGPDFAICDCDPFVHHAAAHLGIPRISFDHFGVLAFCRPPLPPGDALRRWCDITMYRCLIGNPDRVLISSFYDAPRVRSDVRCVGPLIREAVRSIRPKRGEHLLVYFNNGAHQMTPRVEAALQQVGLPVVVYGTTRRGVDGNLQFKAPGNRCFIEDLARSWAVLSTAGNQLVGEALYLGKPMLVIPENTVEQRTNGAALERLGFGWSVTHEAISAPLIRDFLGNVDRLRDHARGSVADGTSAAVALLQSMGSELARQRVPGLRADYRPRRRFASTHPLEAGES